MPKETERERRAYIPGSYGERRKEERRKLNRTFREPEDPCLARNLSNKPH